MTDDAPKTWTDRLKTGAKGFVKHAVDYAPRGLLFGAMALGGMTAIAHLGFDPFHMAADGIKGFAYRLGLSTVVGAAAVGIMGGVGEIRAAANPPPAPTAAPEKPKEEKVASRERGQNIEITAPTGLPRVDVASGIQQSAGGLSV